MIRKNRGQLLCLLGVALLLLSCGSAGDMTGGENKGLGAGQNSIINGQFKDDGGHGRCRDDGGHGRCLQLTYGLNNDATFNISSVTTDLALTVHYNNGQQNQVYVSPNGNGQATYYASGISAIDWIKIAVSGNTYDKFDFISGAINLNGGDTTYSSVQVSRIFTDDTYSDENISLSNQVWNRDSLSLSNVAEVDISY